MLQGKVIRFVESVDPHSQGRKCTRTIIQVGRDHDLLLLRAKVLRSAGHFVHSVSPDEAVAEVQKACAARVWVFCHTLAFYELALLATAIRQRRPGDKLLRLTGIVDDIGQPPDLFDELLEPARSVDDLLRIVADLAKQVSGRQTLLQPEKV